MKFIKDFTSGEAIESYFIVKKKEKATTKYDKPYIKFELSDKTGKIDGRLWDNIDKYGDIVETGDIAYIKGAISEWNSSLQLTISLIKKAIEDEYDISDLIRTVKNREEILNNIKSIFRLNITDRYIGLLIDKFFNDSAFMKAFTNSPGARSWHNAYIGGLLEHTWEVMEIVLKMCELYPEVNKNTALMGAMLHDIGKIYELDHFSFEYTKKGNLLGHISIGYELLSKKISMIENFPEDTAIELKHIILSHHGEYEQQSPVLPKTLEAIIVYHADNLVSQANAIREIINKNQGKEWSDYISIKNRKFYLGAPQT